jgi:hypothetical protein
MSGFFDTIGSFVSNQTNTIGKSISDASDKSLSSAESSILGISNASVDSVKGAIMVAPNCTYKSKFKSRNEHTYDIVSNDISILRSSGCMCVDINGNPTTTKARLVTDTSDGIKTHDFQHLMPSDLKTPSISYSIYYCQVDKNA